MAIVGARPATLSAATSAVPTLSFRSSWPESTAIVTPSLVGEQTLVLLRDGGLEVKRGLGHKAVGLVRLLLKPDDNTGLATVERWSCPLSRDGGSYGHRQPRR